MTRNRSRICCTSFALLGYLSTAAKHGLNQMTVLRDAVLGRPWMPDLPATT